MTIGKIVDQMEQRATRAWGHPSWWNLLVVLPWTIGLIFLVHEWKADRAIAERQQTTHGTITAHVPANHNRYGYIFSVDGKSYTGWESPKGNELEVGKLVRVYYDPIDPNKNALTDFAEMSSQNLGPVPLLMFGIGAVALFIFRRRRRKLSLNRAG